ncbi:MAG: patatin-like phospholipase family protein [Pseudomonadota bacterium]
MGNALSVVAGSRAAEHIAQYGWRGRDVRFLLGASGGPKWLILGHLDRYLSSRFLFEDRQKPLLAIGSSVGTWRHACMAMSDPVAAFDRFEEIYLRYGYSPKPSAQEVSDSSFAMLEHVLGPGGAREVLTNPQFHSYMITARGIGLSGTEGGLPLILGMALSAIGNTLHRRLLNHHFQRVLFSDDRAPPLLPNGFASQQVVTQPQELTRVLHASGSIPFVFTGERNLGGAPEGHYWDGGIIDYHFCLDELRGFVEQPIVLYPHFRANLTPGWFDKFLPWRRDSVAICESLVLVSPSAEFIASLPFKKIPDRNDFMRLSPEDRRSYWSECVHRSRELRDEFAALVSGSDPLAGVSVRG